MVSEKIKTRASRDKKCYKIIRGLEPYLLKFTVMLHTEMWSRSRRLGFETALRRTAYRLGLVLVSAENISAHP